MKKEFKDYDEACKFWDKMFNQEFKTGEQIILEPIEYNENKEVYIVIWKKEKLK